MTDQQVSAAMREIAKRRYEGTTLEQRREMMRPAHEAAAGRRADNPDFKVKCVLCGEKNRRGDSRVARQVVIKKTGRVLRYYVGPCCGAEEEHRN